LSTRLRRVQVLTILVPFIRETRHMDVYTETGSGQDPDLSRARERYRRIVPSSKGAPSAVSRVSKLPTWTRGGAALGLAGSSGTGNSKVVSGPYVLMVAHPGRMSVTGRGL